MTATESAAEGATKDVNKKQHEVFDENITFDDLGLPEDLLTGIKAKGFEKPTTIQAKLIPLALTGKDVIGQAKTGTGKTAAFGLPLLSMIKKGTRFAALVLAPTRELAIQITHEMRELGRDRELRIVPVYGGQKMQAQIDKLAKGPEIIVGTPGRVMDMAQRGHLKLGEVEFAVLDEVDRMFDIGFRDDIKKILRQCNGEKQTIFVSATLSPEIEKLARQHMEAPEKIVTSSGSLTVSLVEQHYLTVDGWDKKRLLTHLLTHEEPALTVVFCRLKKTVDKLAEHLNRKGIAAHTIHGDMRQSQRNKVMETLRGGKLEVLIASDLASRGIDVEGITHVINYDLPDDPDLYVHRIGRTARAGRDGVAWSFCTPEEGGLLTQIENLINAEIPKMEYPDFEASEKPEGWQPDKKPQHYVVEGVNKDPVNRYEIADPPKTEELSQEDLAKKYPGGVVPSKKPPKLMRGRAKTRGR
ncbi:MAG: DEAD/DEAH box helicase [Planctomycetota bacterium]